MIALPIALIGRAIWLVVDHPLRAIALAAPALVIVMGLKR
jgi:hypothetical protein